MKLRYFGLGLVALLGNIALTPAALSASFMDSNPMMSSPLTKPTPSVPLQRLIQPWEAQRALVVALTPSFVKNQPKALQTYLELFRIAAPYLEILVVIPTEHPEIRMRLAQMLSVDPADHPVRDHLKYISATNTTVWTRDYMPQYAIGKEGQRIMLDSGRINFTTDPMEALKLLGSNDESAKAHYYEQVKVAMGDDVTPFYLAEYLRNRYRYDLQVVRPPLYLDGGDFITLGSGDLILSASTLRYNGGNKDEFIPVVKEYFGQKNVHILTTLPGITIDHLDFIMMAADNSTLLIATPPPIQSSPQQYDSILAEQVGEVLIQNRHYLEEHFPDLKLISVPMPPLLRTPRSEVLNTIRQKVLRELCRNYEISWEDIAERPVGDSKQKKAQSKFERSLAAQFGKIDFNNDQHLDRMTRAVLDENLAQLEADFVRESVPYRTYLNATHLHNADGKEAVIIPRYKPRHEGEIEVLAQMEEQVLAAYRKAFPEADLHWLDSDSLIGNFGAVHCITHTVPDWEAIRKQASK